MIGDELDNDPDEFMKDPRTYKAVSVLADSITAYQIPFELGYEKYPVQVGVHPEFRNSSSGYMGFDLIGYDSSLDMGGLVHFHIGVEMGFMVSMQSAPSLREGIRIFNEFFIPGYDTQFAIHVNHFSTSSLKMTKQTRIFSFRDGFA